MTQTAPHPAGQTTDRTAEDPTVEDLLLAAAERMELTERGWIEKVTMAGHGNLVTHLTSRGSWPWAWTPRRSTGASA